MNTKILMAAAAAILFLAGCESTYKKDSLQQSVRDLAKKQVGLDVEVAETGRTLGLRFRVPDLAGEITSGDDALYKKMNGLFLVLVRVALSSDVPPRFIVLDIVDDARPIFHLVFTRYVEDIRRSMAEAISYTDSQDRLLQEIVVGSRRVPFDPYEIDLVRLVMMSADAAADPAPIEPFQLDDVMFEEFIAKVTENKARRIFRERKDTKDDVMLRDVRASFQMMPEEDGRFSILLDLVSTTGPRPSIGLLEKVLPVIAGEAGQLFKSYRFDGISIIQVIEKNTGKMISIPTPRR
jgi:hypothetical protein